jgi:hypothetical protein
VTAGQWWQRQGSSSDGRAAAEATLSGQRWRHLDSGGSVAAAASGQGRQRLDRGGEVGVAATMAGQRPQHRGSSGHRSGGEGRWQAVHPGKTLGRRHVSVPVAGIKRQMVAKATSERR